MPLLWDTFLSCTPFLAPYFTLRMGTGARLPLWHDLPSLVPSYLAPAPCGGHQLHMLCLQVFPGLWAGLPEGPCSALSGLCVELQSVRSLASGQAALSQGSTQPFSLSRS